MVSKVCVLIAKEATGPLLSYMIMSWFEDYAICGFIWNGARFAEFTIEIILGWLMEFARIWGLWGLSSIWIWSVAYTAKYIKQTKEIGTLQST